MLQQIRIQNFKSLKDVTLNLQQVNLLIGPNNSGKSNLLKALEFLGGWMSNNQSLRLSSTELQRLTFLRNIRAEHTSHAPIIFTLKSDIKNKIYLFQIEFHSVDEYLTVIGLLKNKDAKDIKIKSDNLDSIFHQHKTFNDARIDLKDITNLSEPIILYPDFYNDIFQSFINIIIYKPDTAKLMSSGWLSKDISYNKLSADASNLIPFLFNLSQNHKRKFKQLESDLKNCVGDLVSLSTPFDANSGNGLRLKFFVSEDSDVFYWADEVSEGVLYFLALLCIIHQPDPPKLLLLEEPEKGIHPRRIKEVMDFIFQLAEEKNIQIILTSHSVHVVDEFSQMPESVLIFDKDNEGATTIKNLQTDIIIPADKKSREEGVPTINYTEPLSEHWVMGFLGGVPQ